MNGRLHVVSVNQDRGIAPDRAKGAAVHLGSMRKAFLKIGAVVSSIDESEGTGVMFQLHRIHKHTPIDLIYERYALGKSAAAEFSRAHDIPFALEVNAPLAEEQSRWRGDVDQRAVAAADRVTFRQAAFIRAVSSKVAEYASQRGGRQAAIHVLSNGIDTSLFNIDARKAISTQSSDPNAPFLIGFHGRERPWHGFDRLVNLVRTLLQREYNVHLKVIGNGDFQSLSRLPEHAVTRMPWVEHRALPAHLAEFDAMPLTYSPDLPCYFSPLKLMEGMACGVVPVVPDLGDLAAVVRHEDNGLVYTAGNADELLKNVERLIADRALRQRLGLNAALAAQSRDWTGIARAIVEGALDLSGGDNLKRMSQQ